MSRLSERRMRQSEAPTQDVSALDTEVVETEWFDMGDAPRTGVPIVLLGPSDEKQEAWWLVKRHWDAQALRWVTEGAFYVHNAGGARVAFEPVAWTRIPL